MQKPHDPKCPLNSFDLTLAAKWPCTPHRASSGTPKSKHQSHSVQDTNINIHISVTSQTYTHKHLQSTKQTSSLISLLLFLSSFSLFSPPCTHTQRRKGWREECSYYVHSQLEHHVAPAKTKTETNKLTCSNTTHTKRTNTTSTYSYKENKYHAYV